MVSFAIASLLLLAAVASAKDAQAPKQPQSWDATSIQWQDVAADGTRYALLEGRRDVPGEAFTYAFLIPPGYYEHHWHTSDARVAVIKGALKLSFGETLDLKNLKTYPAGSFVLVPANMKHTMTADEETI